MKKWTWPTLPTRQDRKNMVNHAQGLPFTSIAQQFTNYQYCASHCSLLLLSKKWCIILVTSMQCAIDTHKVCNWHIPSIILKCTLRAHPQHTASSPCVAGLPWRRTPDQWQAHLAAGWDEAMLPTSADFSAPLGHWPPRRCVGYHGNGL